MGFLDLLLAPVLVGTFFSIFLSGILVVQCYNYFLYFPKDRKWMKVIVGYMLLSDMIHTGVECAITFQYLISLFGQNEAILFSTHLFSCIPLFTVAIATVAQCFFAWRVTRLTKSKLLGGAIGILAFIEFLGGTGSTIGMVLVEDILEFEKFKGVVIVWFTSCVLCDSLISFSLCHYLSTHRTGLPTTDYLISRINRTTIQTGLVTSVWAIADLVVFNAQNNSMHLLFCFPLPKIYANSMLSTLNARQSLAIGLGRMNRISGFTVGGNEEVVPDVWVFSVAPRTDS
jgi:Family of unknown function (DUF6534)